MILVDTSAWVEFPRDTGSPVCTRVDELLVTVGMPASLSELGIARSDFAAALPDLADAAFADPSLRTNPRMPLLSELLALLEAGWSRA